MIIEVARPYVIQQGILPILLQWRTSQSPEKLSVVQSCSALLIANPAKLDELKNVNELPDKKTYLNCVESDILLEHPRLSTYPKYLHILFASGNYQISGNNLPLIESGFYEDRCNESAMEESYKTFTRQSWSAKH